MKKTTIYSYACAVAVAACLSACRSGGGQRTVSVTPRVPVLVPDSAGCVDMRLDVAVPPRYFSRRSRLIVLPQLREGSQTLCEYDPVVLDAPVYSKKMHRLEALYGYADSLAGLRRPVSRTRRGMVVPYNNKVALPQGQNNGRRVYGVVTTDGCGECSAIDTVLLAVIDDPADLFRRKLAPKWVEPRFEVKPKIRKGRGTAHIQFIINRYDIRPELGNNRAELDTMLARLAPVVADTLAELRSVGIYGLASADGPLSFNTPLAHNRANSAMRWLCDRLGLGAAERRVFTTGSRPEGWEPVVAAMAAAGNADSTAVREILDRYAGQNDDVAERYIRRLACWPVIRDNFLQKDRKVEYVYTYKIRNFTTDDELLRMYATRPDAFSEDELLRVSTLKPTRAEKEEVYRTTLRYYPKSQAAANNLAAILLAEGKAAEAEAVIKGVGPADGALSVNLAAAYIAQGRLDEAEQALAQAPAGDPEARYNLGIIRACQNRYAEAYDILKPYGDAAAALAALCLGRDGEAEAIIRQLEPHDKSPLTAYVGARIAARQGRADDMFARLQRAAADKELARRIASDYDFDPYRADGRWTALGVGR